MQLNVSLKVLHYDRHQVWKRAFSLVISSPHQGKTLHKTLAILFTLLGTLKFSLRLSRTNGFQKSRIFKSQSCSYQLNVLSTSQTIFTLATRWHKAFKASNSFVMNLLNYRSFTCYRAIPKSLVDSFAKCYDFSKSETQVLSLGSVIQCPEFGNDQKTDKTCQRQQLLNRSQLYCEFVCSWGQGEVGERERKGREGSFLNPRQHWRE